MRRSTFTAGVLAACVVTVGATAFVVVTPVVGGAATPRT